MRADEHAVERSLVSLVKAALHVPGWRFPEHLFRIGQETFALPENATVVEVGCFFGRSSLVIAGALRLRGSGVLHCIDPFDCSGDAFSAPHYARMVQENGGGMLLDCFTSMLKQHRLMDYVRIHVNRDTEVSPAVCGPIDLLLLDGDQSRFGALKAYEHWRAAIKPGGLLVVGNSARRTYAPDHDGNAFIVERHLVRDGFTIISRGDTTFARAHSVSTA